MLRGKVVPFAVLPLGAHWASWWVGDAFHQTGKLLAILFHTFSAPFLWAPSCFRCLTHYGCTGSGPIYTVSSFSFFLFDWTHLIGVSASLLNLPSASSNLLLIPSSDYFIKFNHCSFQLQNLYWFFYFFGCFYLNDVMFVVRRCRHSLTLSSIWSLVCSHLSALVSPQPSHYWSEMSLSLNPHVPQLLLMNWLYCHISFNLLDRVSFVSLNLFMIVDLPIFVY